MPHISSIIAHKAGCHAERDDRLTSRTDHFCFVMQPLKNLNDALTATLDGECRHMLLYSESFDDRLHSSVVYRVAQARADPVRALAPPRSSGRKD
jgi:hypothetical protein